MKWERQILLKMLMKKEEKQEKEELLNATKIILELAP
jgi:hypothetical protein